MNKEVVIVEIIRNHSSPFSWYANLAGERFEVYDLWRDSFVLVEDYDRGHNATWRHIAKQDCVSIMKGIQGTITTGCEDASA
jgi:hypothetical protein